MQEGEQIIQKYKQRWQLLRGLEAVFYGVGAGLCVGFITVNITTGIVVFLAITVIALGIIRPWKIGVAGVSAYIDQHLNTAEYSTSLLLTTPSGLSGLAQLQRQKVTQRLATEIATVKPKTGFKRAAITSGTLLLIGLGVSQLYKISGNSNVEITSEEKVMTFQSTDSLLPAYAPPVLIAQKLTIGYPDYTGVSDRTTSTMNVKVVEGSRLFWKLDFEGAVRDVYIEGFGVDIAMNVSNAAASTVLNTRFAKAHTPETSGYYNFKFSDTLGANYTSEIYAIEVIKDKAPIVKIKDIPQFTLFDFSDAKVLDFTAELEDDYGIGGAEIIATVSKGSGESVKFREEKLTFDQSVQVGSRSVRLSKKIALDKLKMEVGDELYFYVETWDQKIPRPNVTRSETFFAVIKDTVSDDFGVEGTMGADLMPDYFRSQRQLIIDTEKLIKEKPQLTEKEFKSRSNELGFDQKALRLKYGQFMGDEVDSGIAVTPEISIEDFDADDPTAGYRHDHDSENEHNLVEDDHDHEGGEEGDEEKSPLDDYLHNHDDPEESTLFTESLRGKLKQAMAEMWDAELYLRLATPKESLPYQYKALKLIQEIKNSARIYVHRIGFDPPPIREEKRLTGDLEEIENVYKNEDIAKKDPYSMMRASIGVLEMRILGDDILTIEDREMFAKAGEELAVIAINQPSKYLKTLQQLKWLTEEKVQPISLLRAVQRGLLRALPDTSAAPLTRVQYRGSLEKVFIQELQANDE
ncbi:MAG: tryptophan-rich sensory protein [Dokdonia sp.]|nr:tryptophan-rich sensory protein [Dokdonia sp.]